VTPRRSSRRHGRLAILLVAVLPGLLALGCATEPSPVERYLEAYFATFPSRATAAGRHDLDEQLESFSPAALAAWVETNRRIGGELRRALAAHERGAARLDPDTLLDYELVLRRTERELFSLTVEEAATTDPLFWSAIPGSATVFLLVREDLPAERRLASVVARVRQIPRFVTEARAALLTGDPERISPELCAVAAGQLRASASYYGGGLARAVEGSPELQAERVAGLARELTAAGSAGAAALEELAQFLDDLARSATGTFRLGKRYAERFRTVTGVEQPVSEVLAEAERALVEKRSEAAAYGRRVWPLVLGSRPLPSDDAALLAALFDRLAEDRATTLEEFVADYRALIDGAVEMVRKRGVVTLPEPLTLRVDRSPQYLLGASVGGVYAAGPFAEAEADTLLLLPTPPDDWPAERLAAFFRDFNHHFNVMITPHEVIPGHYLQLKYAARGGRPVRALFGDGVYVEGWGTFCERLMLDLGWGGPLDRLAHLKKQMENIARTVVDIRVHTQEMSEAEVRTFVREEALQDEQFAANMWRRAMTTSPQLTFYHLGYREVWGLYRDVRAARGDAFELREFMDGMMELGPVPVRHYRRRMLGEES
jgi:Bacterial protein of unknown function (DUF885)